MSDKFRKDLSRGNIGEGVVKTLLGCPNLCYKKNEQKGRANLAKYDFSIELDGEIKYGEVKRDWMESKTGRLAIEYHNPKINKPSGLLGTQADLWIIVLENPHRVWATSVSKLKLVCSENKPERDLLGGDDNAMLWLYKSTFLLNECFVELTDLDSAEITKALKGLL